MATAPISFSPVIISMEELISATATLQTIEAGNKQSLESFNATTFVENLQKWAASGFKDSFVVYQLPAVAPDMLNGKYKSSDIVYRTVWDYIPFCLGYSITDLLAKFQARATGMTFSFSVEENPIILKIHATK